MKLRVISLLLAMAMLLAVLPAPASAEMLGNSDLEMQIQNTYRAAVRSSGKWSFNGYCGSLVSWQTYLLGIDTVKYGCNGNDQYDLYSNLGTTTGGYRVKCYPAAQYDLRSALNAITRNGAEDVYNMVVGFQKTNTWQGSIYGHAVFVHGIVDGIVYFVESYSTSLGGQYWAEGTPIHCSIDTFCDYYNSWTVFDGIAYFGLRTYADACKIYPASMYAVASGNEQIYSEPADPGVYEGTLSGDSIVAGEMVKVTALLETPCGRYYYQLDRGGRAEYVPAEKLVWIADSFEDVAIADQRMPEIIRKGNGFVLRGTVSALNCCISNVQVDVYNTAQGMRKPVMEGQLSVEGKSVSLNTWQLDQYMTFRQLESGNYRIQVTAQVQTYVLQDGVPVVRSSEVELWDSAFRVVTDWKQYVTVLFDGNGGDAWISQTEAAVGSQIGELTGADRTGYVFTGWTLDPEGTQPIPQDYTVQEQITLYAQWVADSDDLSGWQQVDGNWRYYLDGEIAGQIISDADSDRYVVDNWQRPGGALVAAGTALHVTGPCLVSQTETKPEEPAVR